DEERSRVERLEPRSVVIVPLVVQGARQGALTIVSAGSAQEYDANDRDLFRQIAIQAGLALSVALTLDEVRRARLDREEMLAIVSHDLRNPLNVLGFAASLLRSPGGTGGERMERQLEIIERSITQMDELIANLLDAARIDGGRFTVERELLDPEHLVREATERMRPLAEQGEVLLGTAVHPDLPRIEGDPARLLQTFQNLLSNALSFTPAGGSVTVSAEVTEDG